MFHTLEGTHLLVWVRVDTPPGVDCNGHTSRVGWRGHTFWCGLEGGHLLVWVGGDTPSGVGWRGDTFWCGLQWTHLSAGMGQCYKPHLECHLLVQLFRGVSELTSGEGHFEKGMQVTVV